MVLNPVWGQCLKWPLLIPTSWSSCPGAIPPLWVGAGFNVSFLKLPEYERSDGTSLLRSHYQRLWLPSWVFGLLLSHISRFWGKPAAITWSKPVGRSTWVRLEVDLLNSAKSPVSEFWSRSSPAETSDDSRAIQQFVTLQETDSKQEPLSYILWGSWSTEMMR